MSSIRTERIKAVRKAWELEQGRVTNGEGTRDWTPEQQQSILDIGVALDDEGRPFEGQHMKSVSAYPEYAGNPDNIQFLTRQEHLEAHDGSWQNQTNWYYDPVTKQKTVFGDTLIPCSVLKLSDPVINIASIKVDSNKELINEVQREKKTSESCTDSQDKRKETLHNVEKHYNAKNISPTSFDSMKPPKAENGFLRAIKGLGKFIVEHPAESVEIAAIAVGGIAKAVSSIKRSNGTSKSSSSNKQEEPSVLADIAEDIAEVIEKANRSSPREHEVPGHGQHYHTKEGVIWKEKKPYHRGGNKNEKT